MEQLASDYENCDAQMRAALALWTSAPRLAWDALGPSTAEDFTLWFEFVKLRTQLDRKLWRN